MEGRAMSIRELLAGGGGMKKHAEGYIDTRTLSSDTGEDAKYVDVTISALPDLSKAECVFIGASTNWSDNDDLPAYQSSTATRAMGIVLPRLTSATNLRLSLASAAAGGVRGRYTVWDFS
jgi:hypothetical protein